MPFGHAQASTGRLAVLGRVFGPEIRAFLERSAPKEPSLALDLGCGPGHTTAIIADTLHPRRTVGLDIAWDFIEASAPRVRPGVEFHVHDVSQAPFPVSDADVVFCHFLLTHIPDPAAALATWATQLAPGGLLLVDEVESIEKTQPAFARYLEIAAERIADAGGRLHAGPVLEALGPIAGLELVSSDVVDAPVATADAAEMFHINIGVWAGWDFAKERYERAEIERLTAELADLRGSASHGEITWRMRQMVFRRA